MALPSGYQEIPYLEATGTQYINTMYYPSDNVVVSIDAEFTAISYDQSLFGYYDATGSTNNAYDVGVSNASDTTTAIFSNGRATIPAPYVAGRHLYETRVIDGQIYLYRDGVDVSTYGGLLVTGRSGTQYAYLFASHFVSSSQNIAWERCKARIYSAKIYSSQGGPLAREFIPAKRLSDGTLGMYETQSLGFCTNRGTGKFLTLTVEPPESITVSDGITVGEPVSVLWGASPSSGVTGYELERSVNGGAFVQIYAGWGLMFTDTAGSGWNRVEYRVRSVDADSESAWVSSGSLPVHDPFAPVNRNFSREYAEYLSRLSSPFKKVVRLEFLQPDDTVAFALGGAGQMHTVPGRDTRTFIQSGSLSVNLTNGQRRRASVMLSNMDGAFDYAVNKLWFGQRVRLSMGMRLRSGEDFYFPMGVFYIENPSVLFSPADKTASLNLVDKWSYLDGGLFGTLEAAYSVSNGTNIFSAMDSLIHLSRFTYASTSVRGDMIDPALGVYTDYFNGKTYTAAHSDGSITSDIAQTAAPYEVTENRGSTIAALLLKLNAMIAGWIGYAPDGSLRVEPSQDDIDDADKPVLFAFTPENSALVSMNTVARNAEVYNDVTIGGQGLTEKAVWARAVNDDPASDTNVNLIGRRVYTEEKADYWNSDQCASLARWMLKRKTILQKSISIECGQMFHLIENSLVSVKRTDKPGNPVEKHLIQGFTLPIGEGGSMSITATSVNDIPDFTITTSVS